MILLKLFLTFVKIGAFTFGGAYAMIPLIQQEVLRNGWLSYEEVIDFVAVSESTPGPLAINLATYIGSQTAGFAGALCATFGIVLPSFVIILLIAGMYERFSNSKAVNGAMAGLKGGVVGLIGSAVVNTGISVVAGCQKLPAEYLAVMLIFMVLFWMTMKKVNPITIIVSSALLGIMVKGWPGI